MKEIIEFDPLNNVQVESLMSNDMFRPCMAALFVKFYGRLNDYVYINPLIDASIEAEDFILHLTEGFVIPKS